MKTLQRITTINELIQLINAMPVSAFDDDDGIYEARNALATRRADWIASDEYANLIYAEDKKLKDRQKKDAERLARREQSVAEMLAHGQLVKGMFLKITGARDGHGIREFLEVTDRRLVCRQWVPVRPTDVETYKKMKEGGVFKRLPDGTWVMKQNQITEHDFCRVAKVLTPSITS